MRPQSHRPGFTLIELLVALAMILTILSASYGSYLAVARSEHLYRERMAATHGTSRALQRLSMLLRSATIPARDPNQSNPSSASFQANAPQAEGLILTWMTSAPIETETQRTGWSQVSLFWNRSSQELVLHSYPFLSGKAPPHDEIIEEVLCESVEAVTIRFLKGKDKASTWNSIREKGLPESIEIRITIRDHTQRSRTYQMLIHPMITPQVDGASS